MATTYQVINRLFIYIYIYLSHYYVTLFQIWVPEAKPRIYSVCLLPSTGSPLQFYVDAINSGHVTAYGPGLSHGMVNKPAIFTIVTKDAGEGVFLTPL